MDSSSFKTFLDFTKNIHDSAKEASQFNCEMMQARINALELKKTHLKTLLTSERNEHVATKNTLACLQGQMKIMKSALDVQTNENQKYSKDNRQLNEEIRDLRQQNSAQRLKINELNIKIEELSRAQCNNTADELDDYDETEEAEYEEIEDDEDEEKQQQSCKRRVVLSQPQEKKPRTS